MSYIHRRIHQRELIADSDIIACFEAQHDVTLERWKHGVAVHPQYVRGAAVGDRNASRGDCRDCALDRDKQLIEADVAELPDYASKCGLARLDTLDANDSSGNHQLRPVINRRARNDNQVPITHPRNAPARHFYENGILELEALITRFRGDARAVIRGCQSSGSARTSYTVYVRRGFDLAHSNDSNLITAQNFTGAGDSVAGKRGQR